MKNLGLSLLILSADSEEKNLQVSLPYLRWKNYTSLDILLTDSITSATKLLIPDDFGLQSLSEKQRIDSLDIIEDQNGSKSTIIVSQIPVADWFDVIDDNTIAEAIVDRVIHQSIKIEISGESMRKNR